MARSRTAGAKTKKSMMHNDALGGFTIIEVVLVLAIAGLIFLMVFIALPQLQRAQKDTQRREDVDRLSSAITQWQANNNGRIPGQKEASACRPGKDTGISQIGQNNEACRLLRDYMNSVNATENAFIDPDGNPYQLEIFRGPSTDGPNGLDHTIYMYTQAKCNGEVVEKANNPRDYALLYKLEGSGTYCISNAQ